MKQLPNEISLIAFRDNLEISYLLSHGFIGNPTITSCVANVPAPYPKKWHATKALSAMYFGRIHRRPEIMEQATVEYGKALRSLAEDLQDPEEAYSISVLTNVCILSIYESIASTTLFGWIKHAGGIGQLLEMRGPHRHQAPRELYMLETNRVMIAIQYIIRRKRCFLEREEWKTVPWALSPRRKTEGHRLQDTMMDISGLLEDADDLKRLPTTTNRERNLAASAHEAFFTKITTRLAQLYQWRIKYELENPSCTLEAIPTNSLIASPFTTVLYFSTLTVANHLALYNSLLIILWKLGQDYPQFDPSLLTTGPPYAPPSPQIITNKCLITPGQASSLFDIGIEICRSTEYHLLDEHKSTGSFLLLFPLRVAWMALPEKSMESRWLVGLMQQVADMSGFEVSRSLNRESLQS